MNIAVTPKDRVTVVNEAAPLLVFGIGFVMALGGIWALAVAICGWGNISVASVDFWKGQAKVQCR